jgi:L-lactate dehydrogenase complex protein LldF
MGLERVVPTLADLEVLLRVLARSATSQKLTAYTTLLSGPRTAAESDGPDALHVVIVDSGRSQVLASELKEVLLCIRCGACLNICPVYREIGGHAYSPVYSGPIGAIITPALGGMRPYGELAQASSLCGACQEVCPVRIDLPTLLLRTRALHHAAGGGERVWNWLLAGWAWAMAGPHRYALAQRLAFWGQTLLRGLGLGRRLPGPLAGWTDFREPPRFARETFRQRWRRAAGAPPGPEA